MTYLVDLARLTYPRPVLEIGSLYGRSTLSMAGAGVTVVSVDPHFEARQWEIFQYWLRAHEHGHRVLTVRQPSERASRWLSGRFGGVYIDGNHDYEHCHHDLVWAAQLVTPAGGWIAVHDYDGRTFPEVVQAVNDYVELESCFQAVQMVGSLWVGWRGPAPLPAPVWQPSWAGAPAESGSDAGAVPPAPTTPGTSRTGHPRT